MTKYTLLFGELEVTGKMVSPRQRVDNYTDREGNTFREVCRVTDPKDDSAPMSQHREAGDRFRQYSSECSSCFLGFNHSVKAHDQAIGSS